jgi:hypothetical protein
LTKNFGKKPTKDQIIVGVQMCLNTVQWTPAEDEQVIQAVLSHGKPNKDDDSDLDKALRDADRLANMDADVIIRAGQHQPEILAVDYVNFENNPDEHYGNILSVYWDVHNCTTWMSREGPYIIRLPKARELGRSRAKFLMLFLDTIKAQRKEIGLVPYPEV